MPSKNPGGPQQNKLQHYGDVGSEEFGDLFILNSLTFCELLKSGFVEKAFHEIQYFNRPLLGYNRFYNFQDTL